MPYENDKYTELFSDKSGNRELLLKKDKCDKYDYLAAIACGALGGMIDVFFVGTPKDSVLGTWTDKQTDHMVMEFARKIGWDPKPENSQNVKSAIGYLEHGKNDGKAGEFQGFRVNYDQRHSSDVDDLFTMSTKNHHMKSLAHSPDIIGLFFSILNQFTNTSSFFADGKIIHVTTDTYELQGSNFISKIFCAIVNWFGHLMSDVAGSSGAQERGSGIVIPFYELFGMCDFGEFSVIKHQEKGKNPVIMKKTLAEIATMAFQEGYDFRFGMAQAVPVIITELSIRLIWALRRKYQYNMPLKECIPSNRYANLRVMILIGNGTLCVIDGFNAGIRSGGNVLIFFMRLNLVAWFRLAMLVLKEVCIRIGLQDSIDRILEAYKRINKALLEYLRELERIDIDRFKEETEKYNQIVKICKEDMTEEELKVTLLTVFENNNFEKPWEGDFEEHMSNRNGTLVFK